MGGVLKLKLSVSKIQEIKPIQSNLQYVVTRVQQSTWVGLCVARNGSGLEKTAQVLVPGSPQCSGGMPPLASPASPAQEE